MLQNIYVSKKINMHTETALQVRFANLMPEIRKRRWIINMSTKICHNETENTTAASAFGSQKLIPG